MPNITIASYNLNHGTNKKKLLSNIAFLAARNVDVFCFQELRTGRQETFIGDDILQLLGESWQGEFLLSYNSKNDYGLGIVWNSTKLNLQNFHSIDLPVLRGLPKFQSMIEQYLLSGDASPVKRAANLATFAVGQQLVRIVNLHVDWHGGLNHRLAQVQYLLDQLNSETVPTEIICGDFNTIGFLHNEEELKQLYQLFGEEYVMAFPKFKLTTIHGQHLDHLFVKNCLITKAQIHPMLGSDHFPIIGEISL